jgi:hypothetical protein
MTQMMATVVTVNPPARPPRGRELHRWLLT